MIALRQQDNSEIITHKNTIAPIGRNSLFIDKKVMKDYN